MHVADTIGAGDAFTAAMTHYLLRGADLRHTERGRKSLGRMGRIAIRRHAGVTGGGAGESYGRHRQFRVKVNLLRLQHAMWQCATAPNCLLHPLT